MMIQTTSRISSQARMLLLVAVLAVLGLLSLAGCGTSGSAGSGLLLAAQVNGNGITLDDYQLVLAALKADNAMNGQQTTFDWQTPSGRSTAAQAQKFALDYLVDAELIHEQLVKQHIPVAQKDIAAEEKRIGDGITNAVKARRGDPVADAYRAAFNAQLIHLLARVNVEHTAFVAHGAVPTAQVRVLILRGASKDVVAKATQLTKQAKSGADFAQLVQANSQDPQTAAKGGDLGTVYAGGFNATFDTKLFSTNDTYVTVIFNNNVYLFQVTQRGNKQLSDLKDDQTAGSDLDNWIKDVVSMQDQASIKRYIEPATNISQ